MRLEFPCGSRMVVLSYGSQEIMGTSSFSSSLGCDFGDSAGNNEGPVWRSLDWASGCAHPPPLAFGLGMQVRSPRAAVCPRGPVSTAHGLSPPPCPATSQGQQSSLSSFGNPDTKSRNKLKKGPGSYLDPYIPSIFRRTCL